MICFRVWSGQVCLHLLAVYRLVQFRLERLVPIFTNPRPNLVIWLLPLLSLWRYASWRRWKMHSYNEFQVHWKIRSWLSNASNKWLIDADLLMPILSLNQGLVKGEKFFFRNLYFYFWHGENTSTASQLTSPASQKSKDLNKVSLLLQDLDHTTPLQKTF